MVESRKRRWTAAMAAIGAMVVLALFIVVAPLGSALGAAGASATANARTGGAAPLAYVRCATGANPGYVAYQPVSQWFYVSNANGASVSVYNKTCSLVTTIALPTGAAPRGVAYDASNNHVYVADSALDQVYDISGTSIVHKVTDPSFVSPWGLAYVPSAGYYGGGGSIAVTNGGSHTVSLFGYPLHGPPAVVWDVVAVGTAPGAVVFDPVYDVIAVANGIDNNVTVISVGTSVYTYANVPVGNDPYAIAFSPATLELYVTNVGSANVTVIDANGHQWGSISVGNQPHGIAYDPKTTQLYVTNFGDHSISVIGVKNTVVKTLHLPVGSEPIGIDYNSVYEVMEVTGWLSDKVYVVP